MIVTVMVIAVMDKRMMMMNSRHVMAKEWCVHNNDKWGLVRRGLHTQEIACEDI